MIKRKAATNRDQFLANMHEYLADSKATLLREIKAQLLTERDASRDDCMDSGDLAAEESEREIRTMLSERERFRVGQIDDAIERLVSQKYGLCEMCGLEVAEERLNAMPFARLCCDCQREQEREAKTRHRYDEQNYKGNELGSIHAPKERNYDLPMSPGNESVLEMLQTGPRPEGLTAGSLSKK
jgi:RNA polymerase-binding protein DksA